MARPNDHDHYGGAPRPEQLEGLPMFAPPEDDRAKLERDATIDGRFRLFHHDNPHIYRILEERVAALAARGARRVGIAALVEQLRYDPTVKTDGHDFKVNNDFRSRYVRLLEQRHPEWAPLFKKRELTS